MDEGWTRWVLEQYEFEFLAVSGADIQAGSLATGSTCWSSPTSRRASCWGGGRGGRGGSGGDQAAANDARRVAIEAFVREGGTLVCFNRSAASRSIV